MIDPKSKGEQPNPMHVEYLAAAASDGIVTRERLAEYWRLLRGPDAKLDDTLYEMAVARWRVLERQNSSQIDMATKKGVAKVKATRDPALWHHATMAALASRGDKYGFLHWVLQQPELDRATAGWIFLWAEGSRFLRGETSFPFDHVPDKAMVALLHAVCERSESAGFINDELGLGQDFEPERLNCLAVIANGELAPGIIAPVTLIARPFGLPRDDGRFTLDDGIILGA